MVLCPKKKHKGGRKLRCLTPLAQTFAFLYPHVLEIQIRPSFYPDRVKVVFFFFLQHVHHTHFII